MLIRLQSATDVSRWFQMIDSVESAAHPSVSSPWFRLTSWSVKLTEQNEHLHVYCFIWESVDLLVHSALTSQSWSLKADISRRVAGVPLISAATNTERRPWRRLHQLLNRLPLETVCRASRQLHVSGFMNYKWETLEVDPPAEVVFRLSLAATNGSSNKGTTRHFWIKVTQWSSDDPLVRPQTSFPVRPGRCWTYEFNAESLI